MTQFERRGRSEEKRSNWQPYRVGLSDEARGPDSEDEAEAEDEDDDDAVYGKQVKFASGNVNKNKDNKDKWGNRRTGEHHLASFSPIGDQHNALLTCRIINLYVGKKRKITACML